ncbi:hypothetical protein SDJN03_27764, partial [Cucurbita argyrosperma subsp. sororia]
MKRGMTGKLPKFADLCAIIFLSALRKLLQPKIRWCCGVFHFSRKLRENYAYYDQFFLDEIDSVILFEFLVSN